MFEQTDPATVKAAVPAANRNAAQATHLPLQRRFGRVAAFTLAELLVSVGVLALLVLMTTQLINSAAIVTTQGHKLMDADSQARQLLDRMAVDVAQMVKRSDIDYYVKFNLGQQNRNDQIAFYSTVPGYYPANGSQSPVSLVGYRINSDPTSPAYNKMERLGKGLVWNGVSTTDTPVVFSPLTIGASWPSAVSPITADSDYELIGPQVFRFEYYYLLTIGGLTDQPYDALHHSGVVGMQDVVAIVVDIAVIDPRSRALLTESQIASLNSSVILGSATFLPDFTNDQNLPGRFIGKWQTKLNSLISGSIPTTIPREALKGIRFYERYLYLSPSTQ